MTSRQYPEHMTLGPSFRHQDRVEKRIRRVRTLDGVKFFGKPIGTIITPGMVMEARRKHGKEATDHTLKRQDQAPKNKGQEISRNESRRPARPLKGDPPKQKTAGTRNVGNVTRPPAGGANFRVDSDYELEYAEVERLIDAAKAAHAEMVKELARAQNKRPSGASPKDGDGDMKGYTVFTDRLADRWLDADADFDEFLESEAAHGPEGKSLIAQYKKWNTWMEDSMRWLDSQDPEMNMNRGVGSRRTDYEPKAARKKADVPETKVPALSETQRAVLTMSDSERKEYDRLGEREDELLDEIDEYNRKKKHTDEEKERMEEISREIDEIYARQDELVEISLARLKKSSFLGSLYANARVEKAQRKVRTLAGVKFFNAPIGTPITPGMVRAAKEKFGAKRTETMLVSQRRNTRRDARRAHFQNQATVRANKREERVKTNAARRAAEAKDKQIREMMAGRKPTAQAPAPAPIVQPRATAPKATEKPTPTPAKPDAPAVKPKPSKTQIPDAKFEIIFDMVEQSEPLTEKQMDEAVTLIMTYKAVMDEMQRDYIKRLAIRIQKES